MADSLFHIYLLWVSCQDAKEMQVVRYSHLPGLLAVFLKLAEGNLFGYLSDHIPQNGDAGERWITLIIGAGILFGTQFISCRWKLYGVADGIIFWVSGTFLLAEVLAEQKTVDAAMINGMTAYFMMQALSGILLLAVQTARRNVKGGTLKQPVAYIPYISVSFFLTKGVL